ncbi:MAG: ABC-type polysaccharide/polyol phosphate transport system ATPase subunit [Thermoproteota archaeon]|jgi:ABC-type polysaccharide/polyol phosphate transport system ATPase subunit
MNSTTTSSDDIILEVEKLNLTFNIDYHPQNSLRGQFTSMLAHPVTFFLNTAAELHVLKDIDLILRKGDVLGILGVNGAGKSSLCRCIAGMYTPGSGKVKVNGDVRAIFDTSVGILPELTGRENARLLARLIYPVDVDLDKIVEESLEFSELGKFTDTPFKNYSKGMQARLFLSVVSALPSDLLILDEVFAGADAYFSEKISKRLVGLMKESKAVIFVSHTPQHIEQNCNRVILINQNEIVFDGDVTEGMSRYNQIIEDQKKGS